MEAPYSDLPGPSLPHCLEPHCMWPWPPSVQEGSYNDSLFCTVSHASLCGASLYHTEGRLTNSDCFVNSFTMVFYENFF